MVDLKKKSSKQEETHHAISRGERIFDWAAYGGIAGAGVFLGTIPLGYWAKYGGGEQHFKNAAQTLVKYGSSPANAEQILMTTALMQGGNAAIIPIKLLEDHKAEIIERINDMLGEKTDCKQLADEPKQTWGSIIKSRLLAWTAVYASFKSAVGLLGSERFAAFENKFAENMVCKPLGKPTHIGGAETKTFRYGKIAALDLFATAGAATLLYVASRFFAEKDKKGKNPGAPDVAEVEQSCHPVISQPAALQQEPPRASLAEKIVAQRQKEAETSLHLSV